MSSETTARDVIARHISPQNWSTYADEMVAKWPQHTFHAYRWADEQKADAILAALDAAGYRLAGPGEVTVDRERVERLRRAARAAGVVYWFENDDERGEAESAWCALQPADLDPIAVPGAAGQGVQLCPRADGGGGLGRPGGPEDGR